jgi:chitodextrinase
MTRRLTGKRIGLAACALLTAVAAVAPAAPASHTRSRDATPLSVPTGLRVTGATEDSISVAWNQSTDNSGQIHTYIVCYSGNVVAPFTYCGYQGTSGTATITGLVPGTPFTFQVKAMDAAGNESALSSPVTGSTAADATAPTVPGNLRVTAVTPSTVSLAWDSSSDRWAYWYEVFMDGQRVGGSGSESTTRRDLAPGSTHTFKVRAMDSSGNASGFSNEVTVTLEASNDTQAPAAPTNLRGVAILDPGGVPCGSAELTWDPARDNQDPQSALQYEIRRDGSFFSIGTTGVSRFFIYGIPGTFTWTFVAVDRAGNKSPASNPVTLTTEFDEDHC